eukprot:scaffold2816_cov121-Cylindrotheca_fusiformis.AAC.34
MRLYALPIAISLLCSSSHCFHVPRSSRKSSTSRFAAGSSSSSDAGSRRLFVTSIVAVAPTTMGLLFNPQVAFAAIDLSGLRTEGKGPSNQSLANQLKAYDGSASTRAREGRSLQSETSPPTTMMKEKSIDTSAESKVAHWAYRANPGLNPSLTRAGAFGNLYRFNDQLVPPTGSTRRSIGVQFEFPSDWLQLDKYTGGIQYVDQRNGDKLYVLMATLPQDTPLESLPKSVIGDLIFDPEGSVVKIGQTVEDYKISSAQILAQCPNNGCSTRRRFKVKYATVTGNGLRVERRALVDAYQVEKDIYMLMTSSNAVKFEQKESLERQTVENIVSSFQLDV